MIKIRKALSSERQIIREQRVKAYEEYAQSITRSHWEALKVAISSEADQQPGVEILVAEFEGRAVGSVALFPPKLDAYEGYLDAVDYPEIRMLAVESHARGRGIADALMKECVAQAKLKGANYVGLHTADFMKPAVRLYERLGFERVPQLDFQPLDDGILVKAYKLPIG